MVSFSPLRCCLVAAVAFMAADHAAGLPLAPSVATAPSAGGCNTAGDCSLNGLCSAGACVCDKPWTGSG